MHFLITGKPRTGKTTLIKRIIQACGPRGGGFYTEEMTREGTRTGFLIRTLEGHEAILAEKGLNSPHRLGAYGIDCRNLEEVGVTAVENALRSKDFIFIDEIGKMEIFSQKFKDVVIRALESGKRVVGIIHQADRPFLNQIRARADVLILEVDGQNNGMIFSKIKSLLEL